MMEMVNDSLKNSTVCVQSLFYVRPAVCILPSVCIFISPLVCNIQSAAVRGPRFTPTAYIFRREVNDKTERKVFFFTKSSDYNFNRAAQVLLFRDSVNPIGSSRHPITGKSIQVKCSRYIVLESY